MKIRPFRASYPDNDLIASVDSFLKNVKFQYADFAKSGFFNETDEEAFYLYEIITANEISHKGIVASADLREYLNGNIVIHEHTISEKEQQQMELILQRKAMVKPILLCFKGSADFEKLIEGIGDRAEKMLEISLEEDHSTHLFKKVRHPKDIALLADFFESRVPKVYIADGHHRSAATARLYQKNRRRKDELTPEVNGILAAFFTYDQLEVHDYNRVVEILNSIAPTLLIALLSHYFEITPLANPQKPTEKGKITAFINREWYLLEWRPRTIEPFARENIDIDHHMFNEIVLKEILNIEDVRSDERIKYVEGPKGIEGIIDMTQKNDLRVAFCLYPLNLEDMVRISDMGETLPPKSSWFEPRIKNGLIVQEV